MDLKQNKSNDDDGGHQGVDADQINKGSKNAAAFGFNVSAKEFRPIYKAALPHCFDDGIDVADMNKTGLFRGEATQAACNFDVSKKSGYVQKGRNLLPANGRGHGYGSGHGFMHVTVPRTFGAGGMSYKSVRGITAVASKYSRKVFVGGLPPDIDEDEILKAFLDLGPLYVTWPHKDEAKSYFPPKGYVFLIFRSGQFADNLIESCTHQDGKFYRHVSSPSIKNKLVEVRPWLLTDAYYMSNQSEAVNLRQTVFVGGVPRTLKAHELAETMARLYGGVSFAEIDTDPDFKYPKGSGRVTFSSRVSFLQVISDRFVNVSHEDVTKRVEVKPFIAENMMCDWCMVNSSAFFCTNIFCLKYLCANCWEFGHTTHEQSKVLRRS